MICATCGNDFKTQVKIDGVYRNLCNRRRCLICSPFGDHNTKPVESESNFKCKCGETTPEQFYGHRKSICKACHTLATTRRGQKKRELIRRELGGVCSRCTFDSLTCCYDVHHLDPTKKDPQFKGIRSWSTERILREIRGCTLLCKNCHAIVHAKLRGEVLPEIIDPRVFSSAK